MSSVIKKPRIIAYVKTGADQLCNNCTTDQRLYFRYKASTIPPLRILKFQASSILLYWPGCVGNPKD